MLSDFILRAGSMHCAHLLDCVQYRFLWESTDSEGKASSFGARRQQPGWSLLATLGPTHHCRGYMGLGVGYRQLDVFPTYFWTGRLFDSLFSQSKKPNKNYRSWSFRLIACSLYYKTGNSEVICILFKDVNCLMCMLEGFLAVKLFF